MEENKRIKIVGMIVDYAKAFYKGRLFDCEDIEGKLIKEMEEQVSVEPVVKPACETLQKRFDIYMDAINRIDDFFEYRYEHLEKPQIKTVVMAIIDGITDQLSKSV